MDDDVLTRRFQQYSNCARACCDAGRQVHLLSRHSTTAYTCLLTGMNETNIGDGVIASAVMTITSSGASALAPVGVVSAIGATPTGDAEMLSAIGTSVTVANVAQVGSLSCSPSGVAIGQTATCTVTLTQNAPAGGANVTLGQAGSGVTATMPGFFVHTSRYVGRHVPGCSCFRNVWFNPGDCGHLERYE